MTEEEKVLRDRFAAAVLPALMTALFTRTQGTAKMPSDVCTDAYKWADAMIKVRRGG